MQFLFLITARAGSKGIPKKNSKLLNGKPLICYSIELARKFSEDEHICVSTDDKEIIEIARSLNLEVPFIRPTDLATDEASSYDVIKHALHFYKAKGKKYDGLVLLQPTSPLRLKKHLQEAMSLFNDKVDMIVGVKETKSNPYNLLFETNSEGYLKKVIESDNYTRRQDVPKVFEVNGAIYIYNVTALEQKNIKEFEKKLPLLMASENSVDIDTPLDWMWTEFLLINKIVELDF